MKSPQRALGCYNPRIPASSQTRTWSFGKYELDAARGELRKGGVRIRLQRQPFELLVCLLERAPELVTREELQARLWPDGTFVDFDQSLATAVKKIRDVLGDSATNARFIETEPRRGYRFIASLSASSGEGPRATESPARQSPSPSASPAPKFLSRLVGREEQLQDIARLLANSRLLTLTGPGGVGKTRLAAAACERAADSFPDGVAFVSLDTLTSPDSVAPAIATALGLSELGAGPIEREIRRSIGDRRLLLALDSFEQVLGAAPLVAELLAGCSGLTALVTSRARLQIAGEQEYPVPPLELPPRGAAAVPERLLDNPAVQLFVDRARAARPGFEVDSQGLQDIAELCRRLDGLPLALELAAARVRLLAPGALLARLGGQLDLLKGGGRDAPERHRTLRQAIAWSYDLLDPDAKKMFRNVSVFVGGVSLESAQQLCRVSFDCESRVFDALAALTEHSLVRSDGGERFSMLETLRAFGIEQLAAAGEEIDVRRGHAMHFLKLAEQAAPQLQGRDRAAWLDRLDLEKQNFRAALEWAIRSGELAVALRLGAALSPFWVARGYAYEGLPLLEAALAATAESGEQAPTACRIVALEAAAALSHFQGDARKAERVLSECVSLAEQADSERELATALSSLCWVRCLLSDFASAKDLGERALAICRKSGDRAGEATTLRHLGWRANATGEYAAACDCLEASLGILRELGDRRGPVSTLTNLAWAERLHGYLDRADRLLSDASAALGASDDRVAAAWTLIHRALVARDRRILSQAAELLGKALSLSGVAGHPAILAWSRTVWGAVLLDWGEPERGREMLREAHEIWSRVRSPWGQAWVRFEEGAWAARRGDPRAVAKLVESLEIRRRIGALLGIAETLEALAGAGDPAREPESRLRLLGAAAAERRRLQTPPPLTTRGWIAECETRFRESLGQARYREAFDQGLTMSLDEAAELALKPSAQ